MDKKDKHKQIHKHDDIGHNPFKTDKIVKEPENKEEMKADSENIQEESNAMSKLKKENEELKKEFESLKSQYLRLAADFDNFRKRQIQEKQDLVKYSAADTVKAMIPVLDNLDRAYASFQTLEDVDKLKESFNVLYRQMQETLNKLEVIKIKTVGEMFDPNYHEAIMQEETTEHPDNSIVMELQCGYMLDDRVLRPSMVKVASNKSSCGTQNYSGDNLNSTEASE